MPGPARLAESCRDRRPMPCEYSPRAFAERSSVIAIRTNRQERVPARAARTLQSTQRESAVATAPHLASRPLHPHRSTPGFRPLPGLPFALLLRFLICDPCSRSSTPDAHLATARVDGKPPAAPDTPFPGTLSSFSHLLPRR